MIRALEWIGTRARWFLAIGAFAALFLQDLAAILRPALPVFVALMYFLAMVRIDLLAVIRGTLRPQRMAVIVSLCIALMVATPMLLAAVARVAGFGTEITASLIYISAAPPLGSSAALCLLLGLDAALALELTIVGSFLAPIFGPIITAYLLGEAVPLDPLDLSLRLSAMIGAGAICAIIARPLIGADRITRKAHAFDGIGAIAMVITVIPIFAGVTAEILNAPLLALGILGLVFALNIGVQMVTTPPLRRITNDDSAGAVSLIWGNRNAALYLAALPQSPVFTLFVALYQFPMYMTPLLLRFMYVKLPENRG
jgi:predicted Na+-dependent transporter